MRIARILAAAAVLSAAVGGRPAAAQQTVDWTVLVYLNGDTTPGLASMENASISDFNELEQVGSNARVNIVVQWDRNPADDDLDSAYGGDAGQSWTSAKRYLVLQDPNQNGLDPNALAPTDLGYRIFSSPLLDLGEVDMGQEDTLVDFCQWTFSRFPARHYALLLNDTGRGWQPRSRGLMFDASTTGNAADTTTAVYLTNDELRSALTRVRALRGSSLDVLGLDAGAQGILEVIHQCRDLADYVVAPFLDRPTDGYPYDRWLQPLVASPPGSAAELETLVTNWAGLFLGSYAAGSNLLGGAASEGVGVYRMAQLAAVKTAVDNLAAALLSDLPSYATSLLRVLGQVQTGRRTDYTRDLIDLVHFAARVQAEVSDTTVITAASAVAPAVAALLVNTNKQQSLPGDLSLTNFNGLGIYFPQDVANYDTSYSLSCDLVDTSQWDELVQGLLTLNSDQNGPVITISSPLSGATIIENPPQIVASIVDGEVGGRVNPATVSLVVDGQTIARAAFSFDEASGLLTYQVPSPMTITSHTFVISARDLSGNLTTATGNFRIAVPTLPYGVQTFSLPRRLTSANSDPALVFGRDNYTLVRWVASLFGANKYRALPNTFASFLPPDCAATLASPTAPLPPAGLGYWVRIQEARPLTSLPGTAVTASEYRIRMSANPDGGAGWNMIGNPYDVAAVGLPSCLVELSNGQRITLRQAIADRVTPGVLFTYVQNTANPSAAGSYAFQNAGEGQMTRLQGHWMRANQDFTLIVTSGSRQVAETRSVPRAQAPASGWSLGLQATVGDSVDTVRLGASNETSSGYDPQWDVAAPPALPGAVTARTVHGDWGVDSGRYLRDFVGPAAVATWTVEIDAPAGQANLAWPDLRGVPSTVDLTVTDLSTGVTRAMRSTGGYAFAHDGGTRLFRVAATRRTGGGLMVSDVTVTPGRGAAWRVALTLSRTADVTVAVRSLSGRVLWQLTRSALAAGRAEVAWDGRGANGVPVPNGVYQVEVVATAADGSTVRQMRTVSVVR